MQQGEHPNQAEMAASSGFGDEFRRLLRLIWKARLLVAACWLVATAIGVYIAFTARPVWQASALLMPKEGQKQSGGISSALAGLSGLGGLASSLGVGNASMDKLEVIVRGWELADTIITRHNLMPELFPSEWDSVKGAWKSSDTAAIPKKRQGIDFLRGAVMQVSADPIKNLMSLTSNAPTPEFAVKIINLYLLELNNKIRMDIIAEARSNQQFLQAQKNVTLDPLLLNKIQSMMGFEMEREMLATHKSLDVLEHPLPPTMRTAPKRKRMIGLAMLLGLGFGCMVVYFRGRPAAR